MPKTQWNAATAEQISSYKSELDSLLSAFSLLPDIAKCENDFCSHQSEISMFHDKLSLPQPRLCMQASQNIRMQKLEK